MARVVCRPRGKGVGKPAVGRHRAGAAGRSATLDASIQIAFDFGDGARELRAMNGGRHGERCLSGETAAVVAAVARDMTMAGYRKIAGSRTCASGGACANTHSQIWRRATAPQARRRGVARTQTRDARGQSW